MKPKTRLTVSPWMLPELERIRAPLRSFLQGAGDELAETHADELLQQIAEQACRAEDGGPMGELIRKLRSSSGVEGADEVRVRQVDGAHVPASALELVRKHTHAVFEALTVHNAAIRAQGGQSQTWALNALAELQFARDALRPYWPELNAQGELEK